jgi:hypothetical protein
MDTAEHITRIKNGISAYSHEQTVILRLIRKHGELSEEQFDNIFYAIPRLHRNKIVDGKTIRIPRLQRLSRNQICGDSFLLGGMSGINDRDWWLDLLQHMCTIGDVKTSTNDGSIQYSL